MNQNILITGGAGFIGSHLARRLVEQGHRVRVLDCLSPQVHTTTPEQSPLYGSILGLVDFIRGDVTDAQALTHALQDQDVVVHLAAETGTGQSMYEVDRYCRVNVGGTALLLDILTNSQHRVKKLVVASSRSVYGEGKYWCDDVGAVYPTHRSVADLSAGDFEVKHPGCKSLTLVATDEDSKLHPSSVYGITKQVQEQLALTVCPAIGIAAVVFRYQNVYGPGQSLANPYTGILSIFSNRILSGAGINVFEDGHESRDFVFVEDVVTATVLGITTAVANQVFNVGYGRPVSVLEVARTLTAQLDREVPLTVSGNFRIGDIRHNYACLRKVEAVLGFRPAYDFASGIAKFCDWVRATGSVASDYEKSLAEMQQRGLLK